MAKIEKAKTGKAKNRKGKTERIRAKFDNKECRKVGESYGIT